MRRRDFTTGVLLAAATPMARAEERAKQHRIAIVIPAGPVAPISEPATDTGERFFEELRRLDDVEGQNLTVERYSGQGHPEGFANLAREAISGDPEVIVAITTPIARAAHALTSTMPIVWIGGDPILAELATSLPLAGGSVTGVTVYVGHEIWAKRLQILKEAVPSASKIAFLKIRTDWAANEQQLREAGRQLEISIIGMPLQESTPSEYRRVFSEIAQERAGAIIVSSDGALLPHRQLIVELTEKKPVPGNVPLA